MIKTFKTIDEQIEILKSKGLEIDDINYAKSILLRENYFFLSGYRHLFLKSPKDRMFLPGIGVEACKYFKNSHHKSTKRIYLHYLLQ